MTSSPVTAKRAPVRTHGTLPDAVEHDSVIPGPPESQTGEIAVASPPGTVGVLSFLTQAWKVAESPACATFQIPELDVDKIRSGPIGKL